MCRRHHGSLVPPVGGPKQAAATRRAAAGQRDAQATAGSRCRASGWDAPGHASRMALDQRGQGSTPAVGVTAPTRARMQRCPTRRVHPSPARGGAILPHQGHKGQRPCRRSRIRRGVHSFRQPAAGGHRGTAGGSWRWAHGQRGVRRGCRPRRALAAAGWRQGGCRTVPRGGTIGNLTAAQRHLDALLPWRTCICAPSPLL